jgi:precorrin-4/cobalt-precorrin-4 C11-methyltransferase
VVEKASWPEERQIRGTLENLADLILEAGITRTALIIVGEVLADTPPPKLSKLYDPDFAHGYRECEKK